MLCDGLNAGGHGQQLQCKRATFLIPFLASAFPIPQKTKKEIHKCRVLFSFLSSGLDSQGPRPLPPPYPYSGLNFCQSSTLHLGLSLIGWLTELNSQSDSRRPTSWKRKKRQTSSTQAIYWFSFILASLVLPVRLAALIRLWLDPPSTGDGFPGPCSLSGGGSPPLCILSVPPRSGWTISIPWVVPYPRPGMRNHLSWTGRVKIGVRSGFPCRPCFSPSLTRAEML